MLASEGIWKHREHKGSIRSGEASATGAPNQEGVSLTGETVLDLLERHRLVRVPAAVPAEEAIAWGAAVLAAQSAWIRDFNGDQFALGRAYYTHLETGRSRHYFREAARSDALVESILPGMQARMRALYTQILGTQNVAPREGWCGPGVHIFPENGPVARNGGVVHFDTEGLDDAHHEADAPALSLVVMLRPPAHGGALRVWAVDYTGEDEATDDELAQPFVDGSYAPGDALVFASRTLHQIRAFSGGGPRISITAHAVREPESGIWRVWF